MAAAEEQCRSLPHINHVSRPEENLSSQDLHTFLQYFNPPTAVRVSSAYS